MPITTVILASVLAAVPKAPVRLTVDFAQAAEGMAYRIEICLFDKAGKQVGKTQTIELASECTVDDILIFFPGAMSNLDLAAKPIAGTKKVEIVGAARAFGRIEYRTFNKDGDKWIPNDNLKGPTIVGKPAPIAPTFSVNPKPL